MRRNWRNKMGGLVKKQNVRLDKLKAERPLPSGLTSLSLHNFNFGEKEQLRRAKAQLQKGTPVVRLHRLQLPAGYHCTSEEAVAENLPNHPRQENPVVRLDRLRGLPADNQGCTSKDAVTVVPTNETLEGPEIECICIDEEIGPIPESLATTKKRKVYEAKRSETLDLNEEIDKKKNISRGAEPGRTSVSGTSTKPSRTELRISAKNKKCATTQLRSAEIRQPDRRNSTIPKSGSGKKNSSRVERPKCTLCLKTFATAQTLRRHMRTHIGEKPFECQTCRRAFATSSALRIHMRTHTGEKPFVCNFCGKSFAQNITAHVRTHTGEKPFKCEVCQKTFSASNALSNHKRVHTGETPFVCNVCSAAFSHKNSLIYHVQGHTGERPYKCAGCGADFKSMKALRTHENKCVKHLLLKPTSTGPGKKNSSGFERPTCTLCLKTFASVSNLNQHMKTHTGEKPFKCQTCRRAFADLYILRIHMRTHTGEKPFDCNFCGKSFARADNFTLHVRTHTGEKPFKCETCQKAFVSSGELQKHKRVHSEDKPGERPFKCGLCGAGFKARQALTIHERKNCVRRLSLKPTRSDPGKKNCSGFECPKCTLCLKMFATVYSLSLHMRTHTAEKPFKCQTCGRAFAALSNLRTHMRTHTGEKPFKCNFCGKSFAQAENLTVHTRTHTGEKPFKCEVCQKAFVSSGDLQKHKTIHSEDKSFACNFCGSTFKSNVGLNHHIRGHTGEKPYKCEVCGTGFKARQALTTHEKNCVRCISLR